MTLQEFHGDHIPGTPRSDDWERSLWRAYDAWEADLCPGCGQPQTQSLFVAGKQAPQYGAGFVECLSCKELLGQQEHQRAQDAKKLRALTANHKHPDEIERPVTGHRHWRVWLKDLLTPPNPTL